MADLTQALTQELGIPTIDDVRVAVKLLNALFGLGRMASKHGDLAYPLKKPYSGYLAYLSPL